MAREFVGNGVSILAAAFLLLDLNAAHHGEVAASRVYFDIGAWTTIGW